MPYDKLVDSAQLDSDLTAIANAIRGKTGKTAKLGIDEMPAEIASIETGTTPDTVEQATPTISVSSAGLITASATQTEGFVVGGTKSATKQLSTQAAATITPGTSNKTAVASGKYTTGAVTVKGDANLKAANIAKGVSIFGVSGTLQKVATGTVDISNKYNLDTTPVTVSGLGFTPTLIIMYLSPDILNRENNNSEYGYAYWGGRALYTLYSDGKTSTICPELGEEENYDDETGEEWVYEYAAAGTASNLTITPTSDGFKISAVNGIKFWDFAANYIALG